MEILASIQARLLAVRYYMNSMSDIPLYVLYAAVMIAVSGTIIAGIFHQTGKRRGIHRFPALEYVAVRVVGMYTAFSLFLPMFSSLLGFPLVDTMITVFITLNCMLIAVYFYQATLQVVEKKTVDNALEREIRGMWRVVKEEPDNAGAYFHLGELYEKGARLDDALGCYKRSQELDPRMSTQYTVDRIIKWKKEQKP